MRAANEGGEDRQIDVKLTNERKYEPDGGAMLMIRCLLAASLLVWLTGCSDSVPTSPAPPSPPAPRSYVVSGTVFETVNGVSRPLAGRKVDLYFSGICEQIPRFGVCAGEKAEVVETDQSGRYTVQVQVLEQPPNASPPPKPLVFVAGAGLHALGQQPCVASAVVDKDTTLDVEVFPVGSSSTLPPGAGPMISGVVYETTPQGRTPVQGIWAGLNVGFADDYLVAKTQTDASGRFVFCRVNAPVKMVVDGKAGVEFIPGTRDMFFEIERTR
jgi:hypothetical protein